MRVQGNRRFPGLRKLPLHATWAESPTPRDDTISKGYSQLVYSPVELEVSRSTLIASCIAYLLIVSIYIAFWQKDLLWQWAIASILDLSLVLLNHPQSNNFTRKFPTANVNYKCIRTVYIDSRLSRVEDWKLMGKLLMFGCGVLDAQVDVALLTHISFHNGTIIKVPQGKCSPLESTGLVCNIKCWTF